MYNYKYYRYYILVYKFSNYRKDKNWLFEMISTTKRCPIVCNMRNYHINTLNDYGEYEKNRSVVCMANFIKIDNMEHKLQFSTNCDSDRYNEESMIFIKISYQKQIKVRKEAEYIPSTEWNIYLLDKLTPIAQL